MFFFREVVWLAHRSSLSRVVAVVDNLVDVGDEHVMGRSGPNEVPELKVHDAGAQLPLIALKFEKLSI